MDTAEKGHKRNFQHEKQQCLSGVDLSRKGTIDHPILELVQYINSVSEFFTTSSCSGRIILFEHVDDPTSGPCKKGCRWLFVSHDLVSSESLHSGVEQIQGNAVFKFEPFVMHIQCVGLERAQAMHQVAVMSGFRNSGITVSNKGKVMLAVRSTHSLEVPISQRGKLLVSKEYLEFLVVLANEKMEENFHRIDRLFQNMKSMKVEHIICLTRKGRHKKTKIPQCKAAMTKHKTEGSNFHVENDVITGDGDSVRAEGICDLIRHPHSGATSPGSSATNDANLDGTADNSIEETCDDFSDSLFAKLMFGDVT